MNELKKVELVSSNVALFFAYDEYENLRLITELKNNNKHEEYYCPMCGSKVFPKGVNENKEYKTSKHFSHYSGSECSGESAIHWWYKNIFIDKNKKLCINVKGEKIYYTCKDLLTEQAYQTSFGDYRPDATIICNNGEKIFIEYCYTNNKKINDYEDKWIELNCPVIEVDIKKIMKYTRLDEIILSPIYYNYEILAKRRTKNEFTRALTNLKLEDKRYVKHYYNYFIDFKKYVNGELSIEDIAIILDEMNEVDLKNNIDILKHIKCQNLLHDYCEHKKQELKNICDKVYDGFRVKNEYRIYDFFNFRYTRSFSNFNSTRIINTIDIFNKYNPDMFKSYNIIGKISQSCKETLESRTKEEAEIFSHIIKRDNYKKKMELLDEILLKSLKETKNNHYMELSYTITHGNNYDPIYDSKNSYGKYGTLHVTNIKTNFEKTYEINQILINLTGNSKAIRFVKYIHSDFFWSSHRYKKEDNKRLIVDAYLQQQGINKYKLPTKLRNSDYVGINSLKYRFDIFDKYIKSQKIKRQLNIHDDSNILINKIGNTFVFYKILYKNFYNHQIIKLDINPKIRYDFYAKTITYSYANNSLTCTYENDNDVNMFVKYVYDKIKNTFDKEIEL